MRQPGTTATTNRMRRRDAARSMWRRSARIVRAGALTAALAAGIGGVLWAGPQPHTPSGGEVGKEYVLSALERILPPEWVIAEYDENVVPYRWSGSQDALAVKIEDQSIEIQHPAGFGYHPFIRLFFCPSPWVGLMDESDVYGDRHPAFMLGKNHIFRVFYQRRGMLRWPQMYDQLAVTFDLTRPPVEPDLRQDVDLALRNRLARRMSSVKHDLRDDVLDRLAGLDRQGNLLYVEYVATIGGPPPRPGAPPLPVGIREIVDEESAGLAKQLFQAIPEVTTIYLRRICDNRMFDSLLDRDSTLPVGRAALPAVNAGNLD